MKTDTNFVIVSFRRAKNLGRRGNLVRKSFKNTPNHITGDGANAWATIRAYAHEAVRLGPAGWDLGGFVPFGSI